MTKGSHEVLVLKAVPEGGDGILQPELMKLAGSNGKVGFSKAIQNGWIKTVKEGKVNRVLRVVDSVDDKVLTYIRN
jgi:hypothetical protein